MYRSGASRLRALKGRTSSRAPARFASSSTVTIKPSFAGGLFSWLTGKRSKSLPPLDFPPPGVTLPPAFSDYVEPGETKITNLPNGFKIASEHQRLLEPRLAYMLIVVQCLCHQSLLEPHTCLSVWLSSPQETGVICVLCRKWRQLVAMCKPQLLGSRWCTPLMP